MIWLHYPLSHAKCSITVILGDLLQSLNIYKYSCIAYPFPSYIIYMLAGIYSFCVGSIIDTLTYRPVTPFKHPASFSLLVQIYLCHQIPLELPSTLTAWKMQIEGTSVTIHRVLTQGILECYPTIYTVPDQTRLYGMRPVVAHVSQRMHIYQPQRSCKNWQSWLSFRKIVGGRLTPLQQGLK